MAQPYLLAVDAGTTGMTALAFDLDLFPLDREYREFPQHFPRPGEVEHDATEMLGALDEVVAAVVDRMGAAPAAIGITNQRETVFALDAESGRALRPGIVWQDRRTAERCRELQAEGWTDRVRALTGLVLDPYFSATKIEWMLQNDGAVAQAAASGRARFVTVDALIVHHLTGGASLATDPTNASRTMLFDLDRRTYEPALLELFGVQESQLAPVRPSAGSFGVARPGGSLAGVPITGVLGDQQSALYGQGCWEPGSVKNTYGTGCFLLMNTGQERRDSSAGLLTTLGADRLGKPCFALEGSAFAGGTVVQWLRDQLGVLDDAAESEAIATSVEDTAGVTLVPAFAGLGAPYWDPDARAAILGMTRGTTRAHIVRAGLDAIAFQCSDLIEALRSDTGMDLGDVLVDGGAAANNYLMQRQADVAATRIRRPDDVESTARGAAAIAAVGAGLLEDPGTARAFTAGGRVFEPRLEEQDRRSALAGWAAAVARVRTNDPSSE